VKANGRSHWRRWKFATKLMGRTPRPGRHAAILMLRTRRSFCNARKTGDATRLRGVEKLGRISILPNRSRIHLSCVVQLSQVLAKAYSVNAPRRRPFVKRLATSSMLHTRIHQLRSQLSCAVQLNMVVGKLWVMHRMEADGDDVAGPNKTR